MLKAIPEPSACLPVTPELWAVVGKDLAKPRSVPAFHAARGCHQPLLSPGAGLGHLGEGRRGLGVRDGLAVSSSPPAGSHLQLSGAARGVLGLLLESYTSSEDLWGNACKLLHLETLPGVH